MVIFQHRFYGESLPFGEDSNKSAKTLGYLSSQQALADFAVLITSLKHNLSSEASPVVVFGGSYGGSKLKIIFQLDFDFTNLLTFSSEFHLFPQNNWNFLSLGAVISRMFAHLWCSH